MFIIIIIIICELENDLSPRLSELIFSHFHLFLALSTFLLLTELISIRLQHSSYFHFCFGLYCMMEK